MEHSLSCLHGGFPIIRHNDVRDATANLLKPITCNVSIEPVLQPLTGESLNHLSSCTSDDARLDIKSEGFWDSSFKTTFFDVRIFYPFANSYRNKSLLSCYRQQEQEKIRKYKERITHIEHGNFSPLVFTTSGGFSPITTTVLKPIFFHPNYIKAISQLLHGFVIDYHLYLYVPPSVAFEVLVTSRPPIPLTLIHPLP